MKTLTGQPAGWYLCKAGGDWVHCRYWNGSHLCMAESSSGRQEWNCTAEYTDFHRLYTESEVAELRTELAADECLIGESVRGAEQVNEELHGLRASNLILIREAVGTDEALEQWKAWAKVKKQEIAELQDRLSSCDHENSDLMAKLKAAEKWKAVVLSKVDGGNSGGLNPYVDRWSIDLPFEHEGKRFDEVDFKAAFDQAVQKEMT